MNTHPMGCKQWSHVPGMRSFWFWLDPQKNQAGVVCTFFTRQAFEAYKKSALFRKMHEAPYVKRGSFKLELHENMAGGELTSDMHCWRYSGPHKRVIEQDLHEAVLLLPKFSFNLAAPNLPNHHLDDVR